MTNLQSLEERIKAEYDIVTAFIKNHPRTSVLLALVIGYGIAWVRFHI